MSKRISIIFLISTIFSITSILVFTYLWVHAHLTPAPIGRPAALGWRDMAIVDAAAGNVSELVSNPSYRTVSYDPEHLLDPPREFGPWAWWWWPGGDVDLETLERQIDELDAMGFAGFEHEPLSYNTGADEHQPTAQRVFTVGTREYYHKLARVLEMLQVRGMQLDLGDSGWPASGPHIPPKRAIRDLVFAEMRVSGGKAIDKKLPKPTPGRVEYVGLLAEAVLGIDLVNFTADDAKLQAVVAAKYLSGRRSINPLAGDETIVLEPDSAIELTDSIRDGRLVWRAPPGDWVVTVVYQVPGISAGTGVTSAYGPRGHVVDHFDAGEVLRHLEFSHGAETGLAQYFGSSIRGIFIDSIEFAVNQSTSRDIFKEFEKRRGYRLEPYLPAILEKGRSHALGHMLGAKSRPAYRLTGRDERIRYDYDLTVSDLFIERYVEQSAAWARQRDMTVTAEIFGMPVDTIRAMGAADIPQTELIYANGSDIFNKLASAAGALYGRPVIAAESFGAMGHDYAVTPQRLRSWANKMFFAGVNQLHYHGVSYPWKNDAYEPLKDAHWFTWSNPLNTVVNGTSFAVSFDATPFNSFWPDLKPLNHYITRSQYLLRQGTPHYDVLVYFPWLGFPNSIKGSGFQKEHLWPSSAAQPPASEGRSADLAPGTRHDWLNRVRHLTLDLDDHGMTWTWFNPHALLNGLIGPGELPKSGTQFQAVVIPFISAMRAAELDRLKGLADSGVPIFFMGETPTQTPGFHDADTADAETRAAVKALRQHAMVQFLSDVDPLARALLPALGQPLSFAGAMPLRRVTRELDGGSRIDFLTNYSDETQNFVLSVDAPGALWIFNAMTGTADNPAPNDLGQIELVLEPNGSRFVLHGLDRPADLSPPVRCRPAAICRPIEVGNWTLSRMDGDTIMLGNDLRDWRSIPSMMHHVGAADYRATFAVPDAPISNGNRIIVDLGRIEGAAEISVNGQYVERTAFDPFRIDISDFTRPGENELEVRLIPPQRNGFIGRALAGDKRFKHFRSRADELVPAGLIGPVRLHHVAASS